MFLNWADPEPFIIVGSVVFVALAFNPPPAICPHGRPLLTHPTQGSTKGVAGMYSAPTGFICLLLKTCLNYSSIGGLVGHLGL